MRQARLGSNSVPFPSDESTGLADSSGAGVETLRERLERDGYLFLRGTLPRREDESASERCVGDEPIGHTAFGVGGPGATTVAELRQKWGL